MLIFAQWILPATGPQYGQHLAFPSWKGIDAHKPITIQRNGAGLQRTAYRMQETICPSQKGR